MFEIVNNDTLSNIIANIQEMLNKISCNVALQFIIAKLIIMIYLFIFLTLKHLINCRFDIVYFPPGLLKYANIYFAIQLCQNLPSEGKISLSSFQNSRKHNTKRV